VLGVVIGTLLLVTNARTLLIEVGVPGVARLPVLLALAAAGTWIALRVRGHVRSERAEAEATGTATEAVPA